MSIDTGTSLRLSRVIKAPPARVFSAWTEPAHMKEWMCPEGAQILEAQADPTEGGGYRIVMETRKGRHTAVGRYREVSSPGRLVFTWDWEEEDHRMGETLVTVEIKDLGGYSEVVLVHEGFPDAEAKKGHEEGWASCFNRLEAMH